MTAATERHLWVWYSPFGLGGVETYLLNMVREAVRDGVAVWVAATKSADGPLRSLFGEAGAQLLDWSGFHPAFMSEHGSRPIRERLTADLARIQPTLVALNDCNDFSIGAAPLLRRLRPYCTILDTLHIDSPVDQYLDFRRTFLDALDGVAATNAHVRDRFHRRYPHASAEVRYIANGASIRRRARKPPDETLRLLYVGRLAQDQKRIMALPPLLEGFRASGRAFQMTVVGDGPCREDLAAQIAGRGLRDFVSMPGYLPPTTVEDLYFQHDVLVNLSAFEGFSMSVLEALAAGCVPVCTDVASLDRAVFQDAVNCRLCPVDRLDDMVGIWNELTPESLTLLSRGAQLTGERLSAANMYHGYRSLLTDVRARRPLRSWPREPASCLDLDWELTANNPWRSRPHPLRRLASAAWLRRWAQS